MFVPGWSVYLFKGGPVGCDEAVFMGAHPTVLCMLTTHTKENAPIALMRCVYIFVRCSIESRISTMMLRVSQKRVILPRI